VSTYLVNCSQVYPQADIGLNSSLSFAAVLALLLMLPAVWVHAQSKPAARTITVYQDPG